MQIKVAKPSEIPQDWYGQSLGIDIETEFDAIFPDITTIQVYNPKVKTSIVIPVHAVYKGELVELSSEEEETLKKFLATIRAVGHHLQFDLSMILHRYGVEVAVRFDTFLAARVLQLEEQALKPLVLKKHPEYKDQLRTWESFGWKNGEPWTFDLDDPDQLRYAGLDPMLPFIIGADYKERITKNMKAISLENRYLKVAIRQRAFGLNVDEEAYEKSLASVSTELLDKREALNELAGFDCRPSSNADVAKLLLEVYHLVPAQKTKSGAASLNEDALNMMLDRCEDPEAAKAISLVKEVRALRSIHSSLMKVPTYLL